MKLWVGVTDGDWYRFLSQRPHLDEVNFWQPGGNREFNALSPGEMFLFKLHYPENVIVGGGFFATSSILPCSLAWDTFGEKNGAPTFSEMRRRIEKYRRSSPDPHEDYKVGRIILEQPFFLDRSALISVPSSFAKNIVQGKTYDLASQDGRMLWESVQSALQTPMASSEQASDSPRPVYGEPVLVRPRLGQGAFRILVTDTYQRRCAVTREKALPVLQAAHIQPIAQGGQHQIDNGLLLRSDVHTLFDRGYVTVSPNFQFRVSRRLKADFDNGEHYFQLEGTKIWMPPRVQDRPKREFLEWHADTIFLE
ncbi:MAG TPA: HNH endonuclease [Nitrospiraceae bacterium]|jgi:putative restriction endonuclease|nr:HNH endonuclease [Nitrospiraceae bacterium]